MTDYYDDDYDDDYCDEEEECCTECGEFYCVCGEEEEYLIDGVGFADPGGSSALRAATKNNPRIYPCPTCGEPDRLTAIDVSHGYQCDRCADEAERGY